MCWVALYHSARPLCVRGLYNVRGTCTSTYVQKARMLRRVPSSRTYPDAVTPVRPFSPRDAACFLRPGGKVEFRLSRAIFTGRHATVFRDQHPPRRGWRSWWSKWCLGLGPGKGSGPRGPRHRVSHLGRVSTARRFVGGASNALVRLHDNQTSGLVPECSHALVPGAFCVLRTVSGTGGWFAASGEVHTQTNTAQ